MFKNSLKIAWRNLIKDRQFTLLNLLGLASGLACTFLIYLWVHDETGMDSFQKNSGQLYQVMQNLVDAEDNIFTTPNTPDLLAKSLKDKMPEVQDVAIVKYPDEDDNPQGIISYNKQSLKAKEIYATPNFFDIFSFQLLQGNSTRVLADRNNVLLSDELAMKLFHTTNNLIGKTIDWSRSGWSSTVNGTYIISGIFKATPSNSSMQFDLLFTHQLYFSTITHDVSWTSDAPATYVLLKNGTDATQFNNKIKNFIKAKFKAGSEDQHWAGSLFIQKYSDRYLHNQYTNGQPAGGRIEYVKLFSVIAIFILVIACINFMNLATAKAARRIKEVGIKKVVGATRTTLVLQYIGESTLMAFLSLAVAVGLVLLLLPAFREITGKQLNINLNGALLLPALGITLITGIIAGSYPALYLSGFRPALILKGSLRSSAGEAWMRKGLVVFQFTISVMLIVVVMVVYRQMTLVQTKNLGYNKNNIIHFNNEGNLTKNLPAFITTARTIPGVEHVTNMEGDMFGNHAGGGGIDWPGKTGQVEFGGLYVDYDFMQTMGLHIKEGRMFSPSFASDTAAVIFSETAIAAMHLKDPIGKTVSLWGNKQKIIGVVKDFHYESLYKKIGPFFISYRKNTANILVKIKAGSEKQTLARLEDLYKKFNPGLPFEYKFMDEDYQALYASEERVAVLSRYFAGIAIIISCLGLFGLAAFTAQKRQKEIGIRKVMGATVSSVAVMLSTDFLKLVAVAVLIAFPLAWWAMHNWLQSFAYRINIDASIFIIAGAAIIFITLFTISFQSIKAAVMNPVKTLRNE